MTELKIKKFAEIMENEEANAKLDNAGSIENMISIMAEYGLDLTREDVDEMMNNGTSDELDEESLEDVAGGARSWKRAWNTVKRGAKKVYNEFVDSVNGLVDGYNSRAW